MSRSFSSSTLTGVALSLCLIAAMSGCSTNGQGQSSSAPVASQGRTVYPLTVESCGFTQVFESAPQRAVTLTSTATETMLELGLEDKMVGTAYLGKREIGSQYKDSYDKIPVLAEKQPSMEEILAVDPDFVYAGYPDGFSKKTGHTREDLQKFSIATHLSPVGCSDEPKTLEDETKEIALIGQIFDVNDRAAQSIEKFNDTVNKVVSSVEGKERPKVFLYNSGTDAPTTIGGWAYASAMIDAAGATNIFAEEPLRWGKMSWEQVAEANPDIILIYDYITPSVDEKIET